MDLFTNHSYTGVRHTSKKTAKEVFPRTGTQRRKVYDFIEIKGSFGCTAEEGMAALNMPQNSFAPRRRELEDLGLLIDGGETRKTNFGKDAIVWLSVRPEHAVPLNRQTSKIKRLELEIVRLQDILNLNGINYG